MRRVLVLTVTLMVVAAAACTPPPPAESSLVAMEHYGGPQSAEWAAIAVMPMNGSAAPKDVTTPGVHRDWWPRPSPDGTRILFQRDPIGHRGALTEQIWIVDVATGAQERILSIVPGDQQNNPNGFTQMGHAEWSRDGRSIVFSANGPGQITFGIWRMASDGTGQTPLTAGVLLSIDPSVCPDGRILFVRGILEGSYEIWIMNADGSDQLPVADDTGYGRPEESDYDPYCSPDGSRVVNLRFAGGTTWDNVVQSIDGSGWTIVGDGSVDGNFGVARWASNNRLVTSHGGPNGAGLITIDLAGTPTTADLLPATPAGDQYRDPAPYRGRMPT